MKYLSEYTSKWEAFKPSKTLWFWSTAGAVVATVILGFTVGGWVSAGSAGQMARKAAGDARADLVASVCIQRFKQGDDFGARLAELKGTDSWGRDDFVRDGKWTTLPGIEDEVSGAAALCAEKLTELQAPAKASDVGAGASNSG